MSEAKHTPGPWNVAPYVDAIDIHAADGSLVAHVADRRTDSQGMPPDNARLIAVAPEMLEAISQVHDLLTSMGFKGKCCQMLAEVRRKATGGQDR